MKKKNIGKHIMIIAVIIGIIETAYFGFNLEPGSDIEFTWDVTVIVIFCIGVAVNHYLNDKCKKCNRGQ